MKSYIKIVLGAIVIGGVCAYFFYKDIKKDVVALTTHENSINLFQVGVFKSVDNAKNYQNNFDYSIIYENSDYYRVIIGVSYHEENKIKLENYFNNKNIKYYIKEIKVNEGFIEKIANYETVMIKTSNDEVIKTINKNMLDLLNGYLT